MRELLDPKYGMFRYYEDSRLIWFSDKVKSPNISITNMYVPMYVYVSSKSCYWISNIQIAAFLQLEKL